MRCRWLICRKTLDFDFAGVSVAAITISVIANIKSSVTQQNDVSSFSSYNYNQCHKIDFELHFNDEKCIKYIQRAFWLLIFLLWKFTSVTWLIALRSCFFPDETFYSWKHILYRAYTKINYEKWIYLLNILNCHFPIQSLMSFDNRK